MSFLLIFWWISIINLWTAITRGGGSRFPVNPVNLPAAKELQGVLNVQQSYMWQIVQKTITQSVLHSKSQRDLIAVVPNVHRTIRALYRWPLNDYHESMLCQLFTSLCCNFQGSQSEIIVLMERIIDENIKLNFKLDTKFWCTFIDQFYQIPNAMDEGLFLYFISKMVSKGSMVIPNPHVFNSILYGLLTNPKIKDPTGNIDLLIQTVIKSNPIFNGLCSEEIEISATDLSIDRIILYLRTCPNVIIQGLSIEILNELLSRLSFHLKEESLYQMVIRLVESGQGHQKGFKSFNLATYRIFGNLKNDCGFDLKMIGESDPSREAVAEIVRRMHILDETNKSPLCKTFDLIYGRRSRPIPPSILNKYPAHSSWDRELIRWIDSLETSLCVKDVQGCKQRNSGAVKDQGSIARRN